MCQAQHGCSFGLSTVSEATPCLPNMKKRTYAKQTSLVSCSAPDLFCSSAHVAPVAQPTPTSWRSSTKQGVPAGQGRRRRRRGAVRLCAARACHGCLTPSASHG